MNKSTKHIIPAKVGNQKSGLVPRLRFSAFQDPAGWKILPLKKLANRQTDRNRNGAVVKVLTNSAEHGVVDQRDYFDKDIATQGNLENYFIVDKGDYVYNPRISNFAPVGPLSKNMIAKGVMSPLYTVFRFKSPANEFYAQYFKSTAWHAYMRQVGSTGARHDRMAISNDDFMAMPLPVPSTEEQQKIADCLSSLDALIAAQAEKIDALKTHKKGLIQQLFPREGETIPRLRFPEFRDAGEWEERPLKEVFSIFQGFAFSSADSADDGARWLKIADVSIQQMNHSSPSYLPNEYKDRFIKFSVAEGDYVVALTRPILSGQLKMAKVDLVFDGALLNQRVGKLVTTQHISFVYFLLQSWKLIGDIKKSISGTEPPNLSAQQIEDLKTYIPQQPEQKRIADCLSSLDGLIAAQTEKFDALKAHKKGLMQQLFPAVEAVGA